MTDDRLLEAAARSVSLPWDQWVIDGDDRWNSLVSGDDALYLACMLGMEFSCDDVGTNMAFAHARVVGCCDDFISEPVVDDPCKALRRAITRAAAEQGHVVDPAGPHPAEELAMMIRMLVSSLKRHWPHAPQPGDLPGRAVDLLRKYDLLGSPLRATRKNCNECAVQPCDDCPDAITITPRLMREAVAQCDAMLSVDLCGNCPTQDACYLRGQCAHKVREATA